MNQDFIKKAVMNKKYFVLIVILILAQIGTSSADIYLPVNQPEYKFSYDAVRRFEIKHGFYYDNYMTGPYNFSKLQTKFAYPDLVKNNDKRSLRLFAFLGEEFNVRDGFRPGNYEKLRAGFIGSPTDKVSIYLNFLLDAEAASDPLYTGKKWRGLSGEVENGFISYTDKNLELIFGRFGSFWGPDSESLVLSRSARPMDAFLFRYHWGRLHYTYHLSKLNSYADSSGINYNRYFAGHRIDFRIYDNLNVGFFETIIFGGENRTLEFSYLNPFNFFHAEQLNVSKDDNTFLGVDLTWYLYNRAKLYGQFLADDIQIEDNEAGDNEPNEIGMLFGFEYLDLLELFDFKLQYLRITNRTYNQNVTYNVYENRGELIGHPMGPDGDIFSLSIGKWFTERYRVRLNYDWKRKGAGRYDDIWTEPWLADSNYSEPFPTGDVIRKSHLLSLDFTGIYKDVLFLDFTGGIDFEDYEIRESTPVNSHANETILFFNLYISLFFNSPIILD